MTETTAPVRARKAFDAWRRAVNDDWFADEAACLAYLERVRWPGGFVCPSCDSPGTA